MSVKYVIVKSHWASGIGVVVDISTSEKKKAFDDWIYNTVVEKYKKDWNEETLAKYKREAENKKSLLTKWQEMVAAFNDDDDHDILGDVQRKLSEGFYQTTNEARELERELIVFQEAEEGYDFSKRKIMSLIKNDYHIRPAFMVDPTDNSPFGEKVEKTEFYNVPFEYSFEDVESI